MPDEEPGSIIDADFRELTPYQRALPALRGGKVREHPVVKSLLRTTPENVVLLREGKYPYVPWGYYARVLTETFGPMWSTEITEVVQVPLSDGDIEIIARVRVVTPFGSQPGVGSMRYRVKNANATYANTEKGAISYALANAASRFGIALDVKAEVEENADAQAVREAREAFHALIRGLGMTEKNVVQLLGKGGKLQTLQEILDATGRQGAPAYEAVMAELAPLTEEAGEVA